MGAGDILKGVGGFFGNVFSTRGQFLTAVQRGELAPVQKLLEADAKLVEATDAVGRTCLHLAVLQGHKEIVEYLLNKGVAVNAKDTNGRTALHAAAMKGNKEMALLLVAKGADKTVQDNDKYTASQVAYVQKHEDIADAIDGSYGG
jgi:hypothetical protein